MTQQELFDKLGTYGLNQQQARSVAFWLVDYWMENLSEDAINAGAYHNVPHNGDSNMIKSFQEILWASYEELDGQKPTPPGPWVSIDPVSGIQVHSKRPVYTVEAHRGRAIHTGDDAEEVARARRGRLSI